LEAELEAYILNELRKMASYAADSEKLIKAAAFKTKHNDISDGIDRIEKRLQEIKRAIKALYEDKLKGILTEEDFLELSMEYGREREKLKGQLSKLDDKRNSANGDALRKRVDDFIGFKEPDKAILSRLIDRVEVCKTIGSPCITSLKNRNRFKVRL
jgi:regulator of replication initiation timing